MHLDSYNVLRPAPSASSTKRDAMLDGRYPRGLLICCMESTLLSYLNIL